MTETPVLLQHQTAAQHMAAYTAGQQAQMIQQWATPMGQTLTGTNYTLTTTGTSPDWAKEYEVSRIVKRAKNGYFFVITVDATDNVFYRVWKGGWFSFLVAKTFKKFAPDIDGNKESWNSVTQRTHLPATLGSAYEMIDEAIKEDIEDQDHNAYVKEMLKTKPENLKMIGGLEKLAEGDVDATEYEAPSIQNVGSSHNVGGLTYSNAVAVSGTSLAAQPGNTISFSQSSGPGDITGVATIEAEKIVLNGTDLTQVVADCVQEAGEEFRKTLTKAAIVP